MRSIPTAHHPGSFTPCLNRPRRRMRLEPSRTSQAWKGTRYLAVPNRRWMRAIRLRGSAPTYSFYHQVHGTPLHRDSSSSPHASSLVFKASGGLTPATRAVGVDFGPPAHLRVQRHLCTAQDQSLHDDTQRCDFGQFYASKTFFDLSSASASCSVGSSTMREAPKSGRHCSVERHPVIATSNQGGCAAARTTTFIQWMHCARCALCRPRPAQHGHPIAHAAIPLLLRHRSTARS